MLHSTTIAALATSPAPAGLGVVRLSGPDSKKILSKIFASKNNPVSNAREMTFGKVICPQSGDVIDHCLAVFFESPNSFTGEDTVELHIHGNPLLANEILKIMYNEGAIAAGPGEFTRRAFENGKLDLIQAESVADLINAGTDRALKIASENLVGKLSTVIDRVGEPLRDILAQLEAHIDFPEEDITPDNVNEISLDLEEANKVIRNLLSSYNYGQIVKEGCRVLICGRPNAGKSSLLNQLLNTERAIVTDVSGTTRDLIEEQANFNGYKFVFCDSAGITETDDEVEKMGIELALQRLDWADLTLLVIDATRDQEYWRELLSFLEKRVDKLWLVINKIDLNNVIGQIFCDSEVCTRNFYISAESGYGIDDLKEALINHVIANIGDSSDSSVVIANERQRTSLEQASSALENALKALKNKEPLEIISGELRISLKLLEELIGKTYTEDILGRIFSKFCIGK